MSALSGLTPRQLAEAVYGDLRAAARASGQDPDIEVAFREDGGVIRVCWDAGPYMWASAMALSLTIDHRVLVETDYGCDLIFFDETA